MSDNLSQEERELYNIGVPYKSPVQFLKETPEYISSLVRGVVGGALPGLDAARSFDPTQKGPIASNTPGVLAGAGMMASSIRDLVQMVPRLDVLRALPPREKIPLPWDDKAPEIFHNVVDNSLAKHTPQAPENEFEGTVRRITAEITAGGLPISGVMKRVPGYLGEGLRNVFPWMAFPKTTAAVHVGQEMIENAQMADAAAATTPPAPTPPVPGGSLTSPAGAATLPQPTEPEKYPVAPNGVPLPPPVPPAPTDATIAPTPPPLPPLADLRMDYDPSTGDIVPYVEGGPASWTTGAMLAAGASALALWKGGRRAASAIRAGNAARHPFAATEFNAAEATRGTSANPHAAPIPGVIATDRAAAAATDSTVPLLRYADAISPNPQASTALQDRIALLTKDSVVTSRMQAFANEGYDATTGFRMMSPVKHWEKINRAPKDVSDLYSKARYAMDELENRMRMGLDPNGKLQRHNFPHVDDAELSTIVQQANANPAVKALLDERRVMSDQMVDFMRARGMLSSSEAHLLKTRHREFLPSSNARGIIDNPLTARDLTPDAGIDAIRTPAWKLDQQHLDAVFRAAERNDLINAIVEPALKFQARDPRNARLFVETPTKTDNLSLTYREGGTLKHVKVNSPELHAWIEGGPTQFEIMSGVFNTMRQTLQSTTVGPLAQLTGKLPGVGLGVYNGMTASITRPAGMRWGLADALAQRMGLKFGVPGDITGTLLGQPYAVIADTAALLSKQATRWLEAGSGPVANTLRARFGDNAINAAMTNAQRRWQNSVMYERRVEGNMGSAGMASTEVPAFQIGAQDSRMSPLNNVVPGLFRSNNPVVGGIPIPIGRAMPTMVHLNELLSTVHRLLADSAQSHFYRMNRAHVRPNTLNREARRLSGDISEIGTNAVPRAFAASVPFGNALVQGTRRMANVASETPVQFALGTSFALGSAALASIMSGMIRGDEFLKQLFGEVNAEQGSSRVIIHNGQTPNDYSYITLPQELRGQYAMVKGLLLDLLTSTDDPDLRRSTLEGMKDFFSKHVSQQTMNEMREGFTSAITPSLPPAIAAPLAAFGGTQLSTNWVARLMEGKDAFTPTEGKSRMPNVDKAVDPHTEMSHMEAFKDTMRATFGVVANSIIGGFETYNNSYDWTKDRTYSALNALSGHAERFKSSVPMANNLLWQQSIPAPTSTPMTDRVRTKVNALMPIQAPTSDLRGEGFTRPRGAPIPRADSTVAEVPTDPEMLLLYRTLSGYKPKLDRMMAQPKDLEKQMQQVRKGGYDAKTQTQILNTMNKRYQQLMDVVDRDITQLEGWISEKNGRRITLDKPIDWKRGMEQFTTPNVE